MITRTEFFKVYRLGCRHGAQYHRDGASLDAEANALFETMSTPLASPSGPISPKLYCAPGQHVLKSWSGHYECRVCGMTFTRRNLQRGGIYSQHTPPKEQS